MQNNIFKWYVLYRYTTTCRSITVNQVRFIFFLVFMLFTHKTGSPLVFSYSVMVTTQNKN
ncbi:unnamed protein product [Tenebrio molitor]|nr:unnamed protein product [Tenebrio molitor]